MKSKILKGKNVWVLFPYVIRKKFNTYWVYDNRGTMQYDNDNRQAIFKTLKDAKIFINKKTLTN